MTTPRICLGDGLVSRDGVVTWQPPAGLLTLSAPWTLQPYTELPLPFDTAITEGGMTYDATLPGLVVPIDGPYAMTLNVSFTEYGADPLGVSIATPVGRRLARIMRRRDGVDTILASKQRDSAGIDDFSLGMNVTLEEADVIFAWVYQSADVPLAIKSPTSVIPAGSYDYLIPHRLPTLAAVFIGEAA